MTLLIQPAQFDTPEFARLIDTHARLMLSLSPPESCHYLPLESLQEPSVSVWEIRRSSQLLGCGALKQLTPRHGEIKSMHILAEARGQGLGRKMLNFLIDEARQRAYTRLSLETGTRDSFGVAIQLYEQHGFEMCGPFGDYVEDPNSLFMTVRLTQSIPSQAKAV